MSGAPHTSSVTLNGGVVITAPHVNRETCDAFTGTMRRHFNVLSIGCAPSAKNAAVPNVTGIYFVPGVPITQGFHSLAACEAAGNSLAREDSGLRSAFCTENKMTINGAVEPVAHVNSYAVSTRAGLVSPHRIR